MKSICHYAFRALPALLLGVAPATAAPALPDAEPAMWVVKDDDTTIYLFGTFHALDGKRDWFNDEVRDAFDSSQDIVLEIVTPDDPAVLGRKIMSYGIDPSRRTLTSKLSPKGRKTLAVTLKRYNMPPTALDKFKPFFASLTLTTLQFGTMGMGTEHGSEAVLKKAAAATAKKLSAVETVDDQMAMLTALPEAEQVRLLEKTLEGESSMAAEIAKMLDAWNSGDAAAVAKVVQQSDADSPALHKLMFTDRNLRWVKWVDQRLSQPGTVFMAVGTGHLAGDGSVVELLQKQGRRVTRVQ